MLVLIMTAKMADGSKNMYATAYIALIPFVKLEKYMDRLTSISSPLVSEVHMVCMSNNNNNAPKRRPDINPYDLQSCACVF